MLSNGALISPRTLAAPHDALAVCRAFGLPRFSAYSLTSLFVRVSFLIASSSNVADHECSGGSMRAAWVSVRENSRFVSNRLQTDIFRPEICFATISVFRYKALRLHRRSLGRLAAWLRACSVHGVALS